MESRFSPLHENEVLLIRTSVTRSAAPRTWIFPCGKNSMRPSTSNLNCRDSSCPNSIASACSDPTKVFESEIRLRSCGERRVTPRRQSSLRSLIPPASWNNPIASGLSAINRESSEGRESIRSHTANIVQSAARYFHHFKA